MKNSNIEEMRHSIYVSMKLNIPFTKKQEAYFLLFIADDEIAYKYYLTRNDRFFT